MSSLQAFNNPLANWLRKLKAIKAVANSSVHSQVVLIGADESLIN